MYSRTKYEYIYISFDMKCNLEKLVSGSIPQQEMIDRPPSLSGLYLLPCL